MVDLEINELATDTPSCEESITSPFTPFAFYLDVTWSQKRLEVRDMLDYYFDKYVVGFEKSKVDNVEHIHVLTETDSGQYHAFIAKAKKTWKLRGRATKGNRKQYGKVKVIKDFNNMFSYTIKSGDYHYKGYDPDYVLKRFNTSYQPKQLKDKFTSMVEKIKPYADSYRQQIAEPDADYTESRFALVENIIQLHSEEYNSILGTPMLKRYLHAVGLYTSRQIAKHIAYFWVHDDSAENFNNWNSEYTIPTSPKNSFL